MEGDHELRVKVLFAKGGFYRVVSDEPRTPMANLLELSMIQKARCGTHAAGLPPLA